MDKTALQLLVLLLISSLITLYEILLMASRPSYVETSSDQSNNEFCFRHSPSWTTNQGNILLNGLKAFHLKGVSWVGMETEALAPDGLQWKPLSFFLDFVEENDFNVLRLALSAELALRNPLTAAVNCSVNPAICNLKALDLMEKIMDECAKRDILIVLDLYPILYSADSGELRHKEPDVSEEQIMESWKILLCRFANKWNLMGLVLRSESDGKAVTGGHNAATVDWNKVAERTVMYISKSFPEYQGLFFVQGTSDVESYFENSKLVISGSRADELQRRIVYSPNIYEIKDRKAWESNLELIEKTNGNPVAVVQWNDGSNWHEFQTFSKWMTQSCMADNFYCCLTSVHGLLSSQKSFSADKAKLDSLAQTQPHPSRLVHQFEKYCLQPGLAPSGVCPVETGTAPGVLWTKHDGLNKLCTHSIPSNRLTLVAEKVKDFTNEAGQVFSGVQLTVTNRGKERVCKTVIQCRQECTLSDQEGGNKYKQLQLPAWVILNPGESYTQLGIVVKGNATNPVFSIKEAVGC